MSHLLIGYKVTKTRLSQAIISDEKAGAELKAIMAGAKGKGKWRGRGGGNLMTTHYRSGLIT